MLEKIQQLQQEYEQLEKEVGNVQKVLAYLTECNNGRHQTFAYTNNMPDEQKFEFKGTIDGKEVSIWLNESAIEKHLKIDPNVDKLRELKSKIEKIEKLLRD